MGWGIAASVAALVGCGVEKSRNPLSPSIAGPIEGVVISAPMPAMAGSGLIGVTDQPIALEFSAATSNSERPFWYEIELSMSNAFDALIHADDQVAPSGNPTESYQIPILDAEGQYFWRVRALDGANTGPYSEAATFEVYTPVTVGRPEPVSPVGSARVVGTSATLTVRNAAVTGSARNVRYEFQWAKDVNLSQAVESATVPAGASNTSVAIRELERGTRYYWRSRALADGRAADAIAGAWSVVATFEVSTLVTVGRPEPVAPVDNTRVSGLTATLTVRNAPVTGPTRSVRYEFQWTTDGNLSTGLATATAPAGDGNTSTTIRRLEPETRYYWRSRALVDGPEQAAIVGPWSRTESFRTSRRPAPGLGQCCPPPNRFSVVQDIVTATGNLYREDIQQFTERVAECLAAEDGDWGRRLNDSGAVGKDTVAYRTSTGRGRGPYSIDIMRGAESSDPQPHWNIQSHDGIEGRVGGTWFAVDGGNCILEN